MYCKHPFLKIVGVFLVFLLFTACDNEPVQKVYYIHLQKVQQELCNGVKGDYEGRLRVIMSDSARHIWKDEEGTWVRTALVDSILAFPYMVNGYNEQFITIPDFPISWLSNTVSHPELKEALRKQPNISLTLAYQIQHDFTSDIRSKTGRLFFFPSPVALYLNYGGNRHLITLNFTNGNEEYTIQADDESTWNINHIRLSLRNIRIDGNTVENINVTDNNAIFEVFIDGKKKVRE